MKKRYSILTVLFAVLFAHYPMHAMENGDPILRVMSYNIRRKGTEKQDERLWHNRLPLVTKLIERFQPDILGLQEATQEQINDLNRELPQYDSFGKGRGASWWGLGTDEHTPIFYSKKRIEKLDDGTFFISDPKSVFGWMPWHAQTTGWLPRIGTWGKFKDKRTGKEFYLYNTHLDHMYHQARLTGLERIKEHLPKDTSDLVIITGDFNAEFDHDMQNILPNFRHTKELAQKTSGPVETMTGWDEKDPKNIDHILINDSKKVQVEQFAVVAKEQREPYPSDHRPVFVELKLKE